MHFFTKILDQKPSKIRDEILRNFSQDFVLWIPVFFGFGAAFYFSYPLVFPTLFLVGVVLFLYFRSFVLLACISFLLGGFYAKSYQKPNELQAKIFVEVEGKVESVRKFSNPVNQLEGANILVSELSIKKAESTKTHKKPKVKKQKKKSKSSKKHRPKNVDQVPIPLEKKDKTKTARNIKELVNLAGYQEIDREFLDLINAYQNEIPQGLERISVNLVKNADSVAVNDQIAFRALLQPPQSKEFPSSFDYQLDAKIKKIGAFGFVSGEVTILKKAQVSSLNEWFLALREKVRQKIHTALEADEASIATALLIGDQREISKDLAQKIRHSGLSHLLSISGFHLSLAGAIFFLSTRFLLSRREDLALRFDLKKISAFVAIFAVYFYLKIAGSPLPAERAFIFVTFALAALLFDEKLDARRATMFGVLLLILFNPYVVFSVSFQLSFAAILVLISFSSLSKNYFLQILLLSILVQIATAPFLMHHFQSLSLLGFAANILAIPLASFVIMPLGFLALFLMPFSLEKIALLPMNFGILGLEKIANLIASCPYSNLVSPWLPSLGVAVAIFGLLLICLSKGKIRILGAIVFAASFLTIFLPKTPDLIFEKNQKFFALYAEDELFFSKNLRPSKQRQLWMDQFRQKDFMTLPCAEKICRLEVKNKKILVLLKRNKIDEICGSDFDVIVNLTRKYSLPQCVGSDKIVVDNRDFYRTGTQFLFFEDEKLGAQKVHRRGEKKRDDEGELRGDAVEVDGDFEDGVAND